MSAAHPGRPMSLRLLVRGLLIDAQSVEGGVVDLTVGTNQKHKGLWRRLRQQLAHALYRAADLCHPENQGRGLRVVEVVVPDAALDHEISDLADAHLREVWPLHDALGEAYYKALLVHEGVKRHHDGRPVRVERTGLCGQEGADDAHGLIPLDWRFLARRPILLDLDEPVGAKGAPVVPGEPA